MIQHWIFKNIQNSHVPASFEARNFQALGTNLGTSLKAWWNRETCKKSFANLGQCQTLFGAIYIDVVFCTASSWKFVYISWGCLKTFL